MSTTTYFDEISLLLDNFYLSQPLRALRALRVRRSQVIKKMNAITEKSVELEEAIFSEIKTIKNQVADINLSVDVLDELPINQAQIDFMAEIAEKDAYLSESYEAYEKELVELELEIILLETQSEPFQDLSAAA